MPNKILKGIRHPNRIFRQYYRAVDYWPPKNFKKRYWIKFYLVELPIRWILQGVVPQRWDGRKFATFFDEHKYVQNFQKVCNTTEEFYVDIGAGDGIDMSNTFLLAQSGVQGLAIEGSPIRFSQLAVTYEKFKNIKLVRSYVSSKSISAILESASTPKDFTFLNLDIDSYDLHVLEAILCDYRPKLCVLEWNRFYPPSIYFSVKDDASIRWDDSSEVFQGASLGAFEEVLLKFNYKMVDVQGAALFAVPVESEFGGSGKSAQALWKEYLAGPSKWIQTDLKLIKMEITPLLVEIEKKLLNYRGLYELRPITNSDVRI